MLSLVNYEIKKFFKNKIIIASIITLVLFLVLCIFIGGKSNISTVFDMEYFLLVSFGKFLVLPIFVTMTSYVYSIELDYKTLKILRSKSIKSWKVYTAKYIVATIYLFIILSIIYIFPYFNISKYAISTMKLEINSYSINSIVDSFSFVTILYVRQFCAYLFVVALVMFLSIKTNNKVIPIVGELVFCLGSTVLAGICKNRFKFLWFILPFNSQSIYNEYATGIVNQRLICLLLYTVILSVISINIYKKKEIKV